jgi:hypothetical protein
MACRNLDTAQRARGEFHTFLETTQFCNTESKQAWFQVSTAVYLRSSLLWDVNWYSVADFIGQTIGSTFKGQASVSPLTLEGSSWKFRSRTSCTCSFLSVWLRSVNNYGHFTWRAIYLYFGFYWRDIPKISYLSIDEYSLHADEVWLRSVNN